MEYTFDIGAFGIGLIILILGALLTIFHQKIADTMGAGAAEYDKYKLAGVIACAVGLLVSLNLVGFLLNLLVGSLFKLN
jgi:hypothetical protein